MRPARSWGCLVLLATLLNLSCREKGTEERVTNELDKISGQLAQISSQLRKTGVTKIDITGCKISPPAEKEIIRPKGDIIEWHTKDADTYTITFLPKSNGSQGDITPFPPTHNLTVTKAQDGMWDLSTLDGSKETPTDCASDNITVGHTTIPSCYYEYKISNKAGASCDPGVHVTPDGGTGFLSPPGQ